MGFFDDIFGLAGDVVKVVATPVEIAASVARAVTKPVAEAAEELVDDVRDALDE